MKENTGTQQRPTHRRNASSKSGLLRSLVSSKSRPASPEPETSPAMKIKSVEVLPPDHPHASKAKILGERQRNVQSPPTSPGKSKRQSTIIPKDGTLKISTKTKDGSPKKSKSSTSLSAMFAKMNRSSKDLSALVSKDKENATPQSSEDGPLETPIWAQLSTPTGDEETSEARDSKPSSSNIHDEIAKYTPQEYSPSKQRNFNGTLEQPSLRPTLNGRSRSSYNMAPSGFVGAVARRVSAHRSSIEARRSEDSDRRQGKEQSRRVSGDRPVLTRWQSSERKVSDSSCEQDPAKDTVTVAKRGNRVMAAVAALQGKSKTEHLKQEPELDPKLLNEAFETVLDSRNIPEPMRQKMRSLTLRVKADFIKQDQGLKTSSDSPTSSPDDHVAVQQTSKSAGDGAKLEQQPTEDDGKATKRSRARSRTFTFSKGDKRGDPSPSKKQRSQSKSRPTSVFIPKEEGDSASAAMSITAKSFASLGRKGAKPAAPSDYMTYLQKHRDLAKIDDERLHKLRLLLRNETVAWVDSFVSLGGMKEIVDLLQRIMAVEWREDHEDKLLHEALLCLKGLCTTERAMAELEKMADELFPALIQMLFDEEKKGPAEYTTRSIIITVLFNFLASTTSSSPSVLEHRAQRILSYLREQSKEEQRPVDFVLDMHLPRPYRLWCREVTNVTKEVFWIFLHHLNVVPLPRSSTGDTSPADSVVDADTEERQKILAATYTQRHFPGSRPPVPAAPYIGGVEWDATTYITAHLDLLNGLMASLPTVSARNAFRAELQASGFERTLGATLRTCKEKFYSGVHDGLRAWVAAAAEDGWDTKYVREGPTQEEQADKAKKYLSSPKKSPKKKGDEAPRLDELKTEPLPKLQLGLGFGEEGKLGDRSANDDDDDDGWLG